MTHRTTIHSPGRLTVLAALLAGLCAPAFAADSGAQVVISQVFGGGGNSGATIKSDFVELHNRGTTPVDLSTWSVQYASSTGTSWQVTKLTGTLQPGHYYLVQESTGSGGTVALQPDVTGTISMSGTAGKVALTNTPTALSGSQPVSQALVDLVGFGTGTNGFEGSGPTAAPSNTNAAIRKGGGCTDNNDNAADFDVNTATPRNSTSAAQSCGATTTDAPIIPNCPDTVSGLQGSAIAGLLQASDADSIVTGASIISGARAGISLGPFTPASGVGGTAQVELRVDGSVVSGSYPVGISFTNNASQSASCTVTVKIGGSHTIPQIQGSGATSPYANTVQTTRGVLTAKVGSGFFIQDPTGDGDPSTSDGLFVFGASTGAQPGDLVEVTGTVVEYTPSGASRSVTELQNVTTVTKVGSGYTITPTNIELPTDLARYEGMLVHFTTPLTVNGNGYLGDRGELDLSNGRREQPTNRYAPKSAESVALTAANAQNLIVLDDGIFVTPTTIPYLGADNTVRSGDTVTDLTGVIDYGAAGGLDPSFKLQPTQTPTISRTNPRTTAPEVASGNLRVVSANIENFFTVFTDGGDAFGHTSGQGCSLGSSVSKSNCRGADNLAEFQRQNTKLITDLQGLNPDVAALMEVQNNGDKTVGWIVDQLNAALGSKVYDYVANVPATGTDAIRVAMIYKPALVTPFGAPLADGDNVNNRPPLAQTFKLNSNGAKFTLVANHLKSKGSCGGAGTGDTDSGDGQGCWTASRVKQAQRLLNYLVPQIRSQSGDDRILLVGDMNAYGHEDPIATFTSGGFVNEVERFERPNGMPYSYVFSALSGYLDHALASTALDGQIAGVADWHINSDEPAALDYNLNTGLPQDLYQPNPYRESDHDPLVISLNLAPAFVDVTASVKVAQTGLALNRITSKYSGTVTFTNTSGAAMTGPLQFRLDGLPAGVTLDNASGSQNGAPYITLPSTSLAAGASVTVTTTFSNPSKVLIGYKPALFQGTF